MVLEGGREDKFSVEEVLLENITRSGRNKSGKKNKNKK